MSLSDGVTTREARRGALGVVLAGGASRRMGRPKATLEIDGEPLVRRVVRAAAEVTESVIVIAEPELVLPESCLEGIAVPVERIDDPAEARFGGPLRALGHWMTLGSTSVDRLGHVLVLGVDHPAVDESVTRSLDRRWREVLSRAEPQRDPRPSALVPRDAERGPQPLLAMYDARALQAAVVARLAAGDARLRAILEDLPRIEWIDVRAIGPRELAWPCNTPDELSRVVSSIVSRR